MNTRQGACALIALITILAIAPSAAFTIAPSTVIEPHHVVVAMAVLATSVAPQSAFTVAEFCRRNSISKSMFYKMCAAGLGPRLMEVGAHSRISAEAEAAWKIAREAAKTKETAA
jgi:hypothetical protein